MIFGMLFLFGKPGQELPEGEEVKGPQLRELGNDLAARLGKAADVVDKLWADGWETTLALYDVMLATDKYETVAEAAAGLKALNIDPDNLNLEEMPDEEAALDGEEEQPEE